MVIALEGFVFLNEAKEHKKKACALKAKGVKGGNKDDENYKNGDGALFHRQTVFIETKGTPIDSILGSDVSFTSSFFAEETPVGGRFGIKNEEDIHTTEFETIPPEYYYIKISSTLFY